jgi:hypothetical protein
LFESWHQRPVLPIEVSRGIPQYFKTTVEILLQMEARPIPCILFATGFLIIFKLGNFSISWYKHSSLCQYHVRVAVFLKAFLSLSVFSVE